MPRKKGCACMPHPTLQPCAFLMLNIQSMNPSASSISRWKVQELEAGLEDKIEDKLSVPFIALTETWLSPHIADAQVHISGYDLVRSDRNWQE